MGCDNELIDKHTETMHIMDKRIEKLVTLQEITTTNINRLTKDIKESTCGKKDCSEMFDRLRKIEEFASASSEFRNKVEHLDDKMKDLWFFVFAGRNPKLAGLMFLGLYIMAYSDVRKALFAIGG